MSRIPYFLFLAVVAFPTAAVAEPTPSAAQDLPNVSVKSGSIVLKVTDYAQARSRVVRLASARNAVMHEEKSQANFAGKRDGIIVLEMDAAQLGPMMEDVRRAGKLYSEHVQTSDMTSNCQTLDKRVALLKQNESELLGFLHSPRRMRGSDILFVQYRLYESRVQAANASQERADLGRRAQKALLEVSLFEPEPRKTFDWGNWRAVASYRAKGSFLYVTRKAVTALYFVAFFAPYWVPALLIVYFGGRKICRSIRQWVNGWVGQRSPSNRQPSADN